MKIRRKALMIKEAVDGNIGVGKASRRHWGVMVESNSLILSRMKAVMLWQLGGQSGKVNIGVGMLIRG